MLRARRERGVRLDIDFHSVTSNATKPPLYSARAFRYPEKSDTNEAEIRWRR